MPNNSRSKFASAKNIEGIWYWYPSPDNCSPFDDMDIDYLANCLRLVSERRRQLEMATQSVERGPAIQLLLEEDLNIIAALIAELDYREIGEHEDD